MRNIIPWSYKSLAYLAIVLQVAFLTPSASGDGFDHDLAGSYIGSGHSPAIPVPIFDILTFHADGTFTGTAYDDFGFGDIAASGFNSPEHGVWRQIGPRRIGTSTLSLGYDANGVLENLVRVNSQAMLSEDLRTLDGRFQVQVFLASQNPLVDEPVAILPGTYSVSKNGEPHAPDPIGARLAGTYFGTGNAEGLEAEIVNLLTFYADGTFTGSANDDFGYGDIATNGFSSPEHGVWRQTGPNSTATSSFTFGYDPNGTFESIVQVVSESAISEDAQTIGGPFHVNVFGTDQDPLVDDPLAAMVFPGEYSAQRIGPSDPGDIGSHVAGTYFGLASAEGIEVPIVDILTFGADGTFVGTANDDFGFGDIATNGFNSPEHGTWQQIGPNTIATSSLSLGFDANGVLENVVQIVSEGTFSDDFSSLMGSFTVNIFTADQDPFTDVPVAVLPGTYDLQRLNAVPEPSATLLAITVAILGGTAYKSRRKGGRRIELQRKVVP